jgi:acyl-coenzyme A thioesterase PaaI-like protein
MRTLGVEILRLEPGEIELTMPFAPASNRTDSSTQGIITTALDSACGYAAFSLMPADAAVLTVELKTNLIAPGQRRAFHLSRIRSKARKDLYRLRCPPYAAEQGRQERLVATMTGTLMALFDRKRMSPLEAEE